MPMKKEVLNRNKKQRKKAKKNVAKVSDKEQYLEIKMKHINGTSVTYHVPVESLYVQKGGIVGNRRKSAFYKIHIKADEWSMEGSLHKVILPERLVNKRIVLKKGNCRVSGIVSAVRVRPKNPKGNPVPAPPPLGS